jgi:tetratricopeptide (TPR) repeat protein
MQLLFELGRSEDAENILMIALEQLDVQATISLGKRLLSDWRPELAIKCSERALQNNLNRAARMCYMATAF